MRDLEKQTGRREFSVAYTRGQCTDVKSFETIRSANSDALMSLESDDEVADVIDLDVLDIEEDTFGLTIVQLVHAFHHLAEGNRSVRVVATRFVTTFGLLFLTLFLQIFLLVQIKRYVSAEAVHDIRIIYDEFEVLMYHNDSSHLTIAADGKHRGRPEFLDPARFQLLPWSLQEQICNVPLSQPYFFGALLFLWSTICAAELKKTYYRVSCLIWATENAKTMLTAFEGGYERKDVYVIHQLTCEVKAIFVFTMFIPRVAITCYLCWLGCRWLMATNHFADLILNSMSLEFILLLKDTLYMAMVPQHYRRDLEKTKMLPRQHKLSASCKQFAEVALMFTGSLAWVIFYITCFQSVLPNYQWDVHAVCLDWIRVRFAV